MNTQSNKIDLSAVKAAAQVVGNEDGTKSIIWNGNEVKLTPTLLAQIVVEGVYRQASMDSAKGGYTSEFEADFIKRLSAGYLKESDLKKAQKALEPKAAKGSRAIAFSQTEIVSQARSMTKAKEALATLDKVALYDDKQFGLLLVKVSDKPDSLISRAIAALTQAANDKAAAELTAALEEIDII